MAEEKTLKLIYISANRTEISKKTDTHTKITGEKNANTFILVSLPVRYAIAIANKQFALVLALIHCFPAFYSIE